MATITATKSQAGVQPKGIRWGANVVVSTWSAAVSLSAGDVIQMVKIPANATVTHLSLTGNVGVGSVNVGDGVSAARYISNYGMSSGATYQPINTAYAPYTYSTDDTIDITASAISLSSLVGGFNLIVHFTMDP